MKISAKIILLWIVVLCSPYPYIHSMGCCLPKWSKKVSPVEQSRADLLLSHTIENHNYKEIEIALELGANPNGIFYDKVFDRNTSILLLAVTGLRPDERIIKLLLDHKANPNLKPVPSIFGNSTPLLAATRTTPAIFKLILDHTNATSKPYNANIISKIVCPYSCFCDEERVLYIVSAMKKLELDDSHIKLAYKEMQDKIFVYSRYDRDEANRKKYEHSVQLLDSICKEKKYEFT